MSSPAQTCHPDEGRIPFDTQSHLMKDDVFLLAHNIIEKAPNINVEPILCDLLRPFSLLVSSFVEMRRGCGVVLY